MSVTNAFIAELIRAANDVEKLGFFEQRRLLERAVTTIREMRQSVGIHKSARGHDTLTDLKILVANVDVLPIAPQEVKEGLLKAAAMIRDLHIVLDTRTMIAVRE